MRNVAASYLLCSCRANAVQQSGNPAAAAPPSNAQVCSFPTHPTLRYSARAPRPCLPLLLPASLPSPARLHNVCAPRATPRKPALARSPPACQHPEHRYRREPSTSPCRSHDATDPAGRAVSYEQYGSSVRLSRSAQRAEHVPVPLVRWRRLY
jgi:hypothetical protein